MTFFGTGSFNIHVLAHTSPAKVTTTVLITYEYNSINAGVLVHGQNNPYLHPYAKGIPPNSINAKWKKDAIQL